MNKAFSDKDNNTPEKIAVARVIKSHGLRGEVILAPYRGLDESFQNISTLWLKVEDIEKCMEISSMRPHKGRYIVKFRDIDRVEDTETLIGCEMFADAAILDKKALEGLFLDKPEGVKVFDTDDRFVGMLQGLLETGAHPVLVIKNEDGKELLIPAVEEFIVNIDIPNKRLVLSPPDGIYEINDF